MSRSYQIHEFAELAGVTVKALHHYDRLGLLKPGRSGGGYRLYTERDLERLEQIIALKFLGLPLKQIQAVLDRAALDLPDALRVQRGVLEEKQQLLGRAIRAIQEAERAIEPGKPADPAILKRIIEAMDMQESVEVMKRYYKTEEAWVKRRQHYELWPSQEWKELYRDVEAASGEDPAGEKAQALATRWMNLMENETGGDPEGRAGMIGAWYDRRYWPSTLQQRVSGIDLDKVWEFIGKAIAARGKDAFGGKGWAAMAGLTREEEDFLAAATTLEEDPGSERAQALAARWWKLDPTGERAQRLVAYWKHLAGRPPGGEEAVQRQIALFTLERMAGVVAKGSYVRMKKVDEFYRDVEAALGEDPAGERGQALAARWAELSEADPGANIPTGFLNACPVLRHHVAFEKVVDFLDRATAVRAASFPPAPPAGAQPRSRA
ncbi:MAG: MerR family transcriptional regulator [Acidobacteria bacterium]|nr:MerR family transcriptional regulator [Acidobacteriota bacterium]